MKRIVKNLKVSTIVSAILILLCTLLFSTAPASASVSADDVLVKTTLNAVTDNTIMVAASNAAAGDKTSAQYICDATDDQKEIQSAIKAANGKEVLLSAGTFYISIAISISVSGTTLSGTGSTTVFKTASTNGLIWIAKTIMGVTVQNLVLDGNSTGTGNGINFCGPRTTLVNIESKNWGKYGILANDACTGSQIIGCTTFNNAAGGIALQNFPNNILVQNCTSYSNGNHGICICNGTNNTIDGCESYSNKINGIAVAYKSTYNVISNNHCYSNGRTGITWGFNGICIFGPGNDYNSVIGNICEDNGSIEHEGHGISIDGNGNIPILGNVVEGNICKNNHGKGMEIQFAKSTVIKDNIVFNNNLSNHWENSGIDLTRYVTYSIITGNYCYDDRSTPIQKYGIIERAATYNKAPSNNGYNQIYNNTAYGNALGQIKINTTTSTSLNNKLIAVSQQGISK